MLNVSKFGKLLLSAYLMDKIKKENSSKQDSGLLKKYAELALAAYILKKLKSVKSENNEVVDTEEIEMSEIEEGSKVKGRKHVVTGAVAGASGIAVGAIGALAGITILYVAKKQMDKRRKSKIAVQ